MFCFNFNFVIRSLFTNFALFLFNITNKIMKKKGNRCDYTVSRNEELVEAFRKRLGKKSVNVKDIFSDLTRAGASRFYISEERAFRLVRAMLNGEPIPGYDLFIPQRRRLLQDIARLTEELMEGNPGMSLRDAVYQAVNSPAPSFYLTTGSIRTIIYRHLRS